MLRVYHSNRLDVLEALMEYIVEQERLDDPFEPEMVLVQSTGMAQWLQMSLSQKFGIAANIDFRCPRALSGRCLFASCRIFLSRAPSTNKVWPGN